MRQAARKVKGVWAFSGLPCPFGPIGAGCAWLMLRPQIGSGTLPTFEGRSSGINGLT